VELSALGRIGISADLNHVIVPEGPERASIPIPDEHNLRCRQSQLTDNFTVQLEHHVHQRMELASHSSTQWGIRLYTSSNAVQMLSFQTTPASTCCRDYQLKQTPQMLFSTSRHAPTGCIHVYLFPKPGSALIHLFSYSFRPFE
jgi:hypothetical protein